MTYDELRERAQRAIRDELPASRGPAPSDGWTYDHMARSAADAAIRAVIEALAQEAEYHGGYWMTSHRKDVPTRRASEWLQSHLPEDQR